MVVYYSWSGNTRAYAEAMAKKKEMPLFQLMEKKARKTMGKMSFLKACMQGVMKTETEVVSLPEIHSCDEIFICSPIWADGPAPAVRYFLDKAKLKDKKISFLLTYGSTNPDVFKKNIFDIAKDKGCIVEHMYAFSAKFRQPIDKQAVEDNIENMALSREVCK